MIRFLLLVFFFAFSSASFAQSMTRMKFGEGWDIIRSGNSVRFVPSGWGGTNAVAMPASTWSGAPGKIISAGNDVKVIGQVAVPVAESLLPVVAEAAISRAGFARGVAMVGFGAAGGWLGLLAAAPSVIEWLESSGKLQLDRSTGVLNKIVYGSSTIQCYPPEPDQGYAYQVYISWPQITIAPNPPGYSGCYVDGFNPTAICGDPNNPACASSSGRTGYIPKKPLEAHFIPASMDDIAPYMDAPTAPALSPIVVSDGVDKAGIDPFGGADPNQFSKVSGPASVPGRSKTTVTDTRVSPGTTNEVPSGSTPSDPATKTTTETKTQKLDYKDNIVTSTTVTNTTTNITNNITNQTNTVNNTEQTEQNDQEQDSANDTPLDDIPKLYERKYPDGIEGIWNTKSQELKQTSLMTFVDTLLPKFNSGTCPSWHIDLSFASWADYGSQDISPPCDLWTFARVVILVSALLLARALIFGG